MGPKLQASCWQDRFIGLSIKMEVQEEEEVDVAVIGLGRAQHGGCGLGDSRAQHRGGGLGTDRARNSAGADGDHLGSHAVPDESEKRR